MAIFESIHITSDKNVKRLKCLIITMISIKLF